MEHRTSGHPVRSSRVLALVSSGVLALLLVCLVLVGSRQASAQVPTPQVPSQPRLGPLQSAIKIEFRYSGGDPTGASSAADQFAALLAEETGLAVSADIQVCEATVVEHLGTGQAHVAPLRGVAYVLGHDRYGIEAELVNELRGASAYRGQINVAAAGGYTDVLDLQGTRFASTDPGSASGYMLPYLLISETAGLTPTAFFSEVSFVGSHSQVIRDIYEGNADCGATYEDARSSVAGQYPDVLDVVSVLTYTRYLPNDPWAFYQGLDAAVVLTLTNGIVAVAATPEGESALETVLSTDLTGIATTQDSAYDIVRDLVAAFGLQLDPCYTAYLPTVFVDYGP
jgi:phosphonate transport system substrate-binding protein